MLDSEEAPRAPRRRGAQPGNLNAFKDGRSSRRLAHSYRMALPREVREHLALVVRAVVGLELARLGVRPTSEERVEAVRRAVRRVHRAMSGPNYREARSPNEVFRWLHEALTTALADAPEPLDVPPAATRKHLENEGNE